MKTKDKGDLAAAQAIAHFVSSGYEVSLPIGDRKPYDMIIELDNALFKVQVKYAGFYSGSKRFKAALRTMGGNRSFSTVKKYTATDFDLLFVYTENGRKFLFPWKDIENRNSISVEASKFANYEVK